jgi:hypothetical protein
MRKIQSSTARLTRLSEELNHSDWSDRVCILEQIIAEANAVEAITKRLLEDELGAIGLPAPL